MRWREVEGWVACGCCAAHRGYGYGAWQSAASATATVHGKSGLALAGARQIGACLLVDELPHGALGAVAQFAVAVHRVRVARLAEVLPQLRELVLVLVVVREAIGAEHVQGVRRVLLAGEQVGEQACRRGISPYVASPPHYLRTTCERLTSYWFGWRTFCIL